MKLVITLNQQELLSNSMNIGNTAYTLTAMYSELSDILKDSVSYYKDILANTYFENYEDVDPEEYDGDDDMEVSFIEMPYIASAVDDICQDILRFKRIFDKMNKTSDEENQLNFDPMIFVVIEGSIKNSIIEILNKFFKRNYLDLECIDYLEYCGMDTMEQLGKSISLNFNNSMFYKDDSLLCAYTVTKALTVTNGVYDMGY